MKRGRFLAAGIGLPVLAPSESWSGRKEHSHGKKRQDRRTSLFARRMAGDPARLGEARKMAKAALDGLRSVQVMQLYLGSDPRLKPALSPRQSSILALLAEQFRLTNPDLQDVMNVADVYQRLLHRLNRLERTSFRMVTNAVASQGRGPGGGDTFGYVRPEQPDLIYLNEMYFSLTGKGGPSGVDEMHILQPLDSRAEVILHEAVHGLFRAGAAGAVHRDVDRGGTLEADDKTGYPQIKTYSQAIGDAYVYGRFAHAVYSLQKGN